MMSVGAMQDRGQEKPRSQEPGTWPHQKNICILGSVCACVHACAYTLWTWWLLRTMKSNWHSLPLCGMRLLLWFYPTCFLEAASFLKHFYLSQVGMLLWQSWDYDFALCPTENCCWFLFIGIPYPLNGKGRDLKSFRGSHMISCHLTKSQLTVWELRHRVTVYLM